MISSIVLASVLAISSIQAIHPVANATVGPAQANVTQAIQDDWDMLDKKDQTASKKFQRQSFLIAIQDYNCARLLPADLGRPELFNCSYKVTLRSIGDSTISNGEGRGFFGKVGTKWKVYHLPPMPPPVLLPQPKP